MKMDLMNCDFYVLEQYLFFAIFKMESNQLTTLRAPGEVTFSEKSGSRGNKSRKSFKKLEILNAAEPGDYAEKEPCEQTPQTNYENYRYYEKQEHNAYRTQQSSKQYLKDLQKTKGNILTKRAKSGVYIGRPFLKPSAQNTQSPQLDMLIQNAPSMPNINISFALLNSESFQKPNGGQNIAERGPETAISSVLQHKVDSSTNMNLSSGPLSQIAGFQQYNNRSNVNIENYLQSQHEGPQGSLNLIIVDNKTQKMKRQKLSLVSMADRFDSGYNLDGTQNNNRISGNLYHRESQRQKTPQITGQISLSQANRFVESQLRRSSQQDLKQSSQNPTSNGLFRSYITKSQKRYSRQEQISNISLGDLTPTVELMQKNRINTQSNLEQSRLRSRLQMAFNNSSLDSTSKLASNMKEVKVEASSAVGAAPEPQRCESLKTEYDDLSKDQINALLKNIVSAKHQWTRQQTPQPSTTLMESQHRAEQPTTRTSNLLDTSSFSEHTRRRNNISCFTTQNPRISKSIMEPQTESNSVFKTPKIHTNSFETQYQLFLNEGLVIKNTDPDAKLTENDQRQPILTQDSLFHQDLKASDRQSRLNSLRLQIKTPSVVTTLASLRESGVFKESEPKFLQQIQEDFVHKICKLETRAQSELQTPKWCTRQIGQRHELINILHSEKVSPHFNTDFDLSNASQKIQNQQIQQLREAARVKKAQEYMAQFKPTKEFVKALIKTLDQSLDARGRLQAANHLKFFIKAKMGWRNVESINRTYKESMQEFMTKFQQTISTYTQIEVRRDKMKYLEFMQNNSLVIQMIQKSANDPVFIKQIAGAKPETQEFINLVLETFQLIELKKQPQTRQQLLAKRNEMLPDDFDHVLDHDLQDLFGLKTRKQLIQQKMTQKSLLQQRMKGFVITQKAAINTSSQFASKTRQDGKFDLYKVFTMTSQLFDEDNPNKLATGKIFKRGDFIRTRKINFDSRGMRKFRRAVANNYLKRPLSYYEDMPDWKTNVVLVNKMFILRNFMNDMFPAKVYANIGQKFSVINKNIYTNDFYYGIMNEARDQEDYQMFKLYFNLAQINKQVRSVLRKKSPEPAAADDKGEGAGHHEETRSEDTEEREGKADGGEDCCETNLATQKMKLNNLFLMQTGKQAFYKQAKKGGLGVPEDDNQQIGFWNQDQHQQIGDAAALAYMQKQSKDRVPCPKFVTFTQHIMLLSQQSISDSDAEALKNYMSKTGLLTDKRVYKLYLDQCLMTDKAFGSVLEGIYEQCVKHPGGSHVKQQNLQSLIYSNNKFGCISLKRLRPLIPHIFELNLNNLHLECGYIDDEFYDQSGIIESVLRATALNATKLMKLTMSKMDLRHAKIMKYLCDSLLGNKNIIVLNLSRCNLFAKQLNEILGTIVALGITDGFSKDKVCFLRNLNLSYNLLNFNEKSSEFQDSKEFMENMNEFVKTSKQLTHLNLSGMNFQKPQIIELLNNVRECKYLLSIHLSDNGITQSDKGHVADIEFYYDCLEPFGITDTDLIEINRSMRTETKVNPNEKKRYDAIVIDYKKHLDQYFKFEVHKGHSCTTMVKLYKDKLLLAKERKILDQFKAINEAQVFYGCGRQQDNGMFDRFVLTRHMNAPGMIFNQTIKGDFDTFDFQRFFNKASSMSWKLSKSNECYICQKYQYTAIFYDRWTLARNEDLVEIKDQEFLDLLKKDFNANYSKYMSLGPIICGTVVNRGIGQPQFDRKLKMMNCSLYCLLQLLQSKDFNNDIEQGLKMMEIMEQFLQKEPYHLLKQMNILSKLEGWELLLKQKFTQNELMDIKNINLPNFEMKIEEQDWFIFTDFVKPGYHQILIYDPLLHKAFCKDFIVNLNLREDIYPEYPNQELVAKKPVVNVWRQWLEDTQEDVFKSYQNELIETDNFMITKFVKDEGDAGNCLMILMENFEIIKIYQKHLQFGSKQYPQIDWNRVWLHLDLVNNTSSEIKSKNMKVQRGMAELAFIRATRKDSTQRLGSALQRAEIFEFILKLAHMWTAEAYPSKEDLSKHLGEFIRIFIQPFYNSSIIIQQRISIRDSKFLNQFLYDNLDGIKAIFEAAKQNMQPKASSWGALAALSAKKKSMMAEKNWPSDKFTLEVANELFGKIEHEDYTISPKIIEQCFQFSMMTVLNEYKNSKKYFYLNFVEFLDMLCRLNIVANTREDTQDHKCEFFLGLLFKQMYAQNWLYMSEHKLVPVEEELR